MNHTSYRIRYVITKNRWCGHVNRAHKSNGIALEVDLTFRVLTQVRKPQPKPALHVRTQVRKQYLT